MDRHYGPALWTGTTDRHYGPALSLCLSLCLYLCLYLHFLLSLYLSISLSGLSLSQTIESYTYSGLTDWHCVWGYTGLSGACLITKSHADSIPVRLYGQSLPAWPLLTRS